MRPIIRIIIAFVVMVFTPTVCWYLYYDVILPLSEFTLGVVSGNIATVLYMYILYFSKGGFKTKDNAGN